MHAMPTLGHEDAMRAIEAIRAELSRGGQAAVVAVADPNGELIGLLRLDGSLISSVQIAIAKAFTAARLRRRRSGNFNTTRDGTRPQAATSTHRHRRHQPITHPVQGSS
jgi:uncharacterized protein GlcG (DUF336 family)